MVNFLFKKIHVVFNYRFCSQNYLVKNQKKIRDYVCKLTLYSTEHLKNPYR